LQHGDLQIRLIESVWNIPTQWSVFASFLDDCVEETNAKEQPSEGTILFGAAQIKLWLIDGLRVVGTHEILSQSRRRFIGHFHAILEYRHGKLWRRIRRKPNTKIGYKIN